MLVGTTSIEKSEQLAEAMQKRGYKQIDFLQPEALQKLYAAARSGPSKVFAVLTARFHEQAYIVAQAGVPGRITVATNIAGRGTDIQLGGNVEMRVAQVRRIVARPGAQTKEAEIRGGNVPRESDSRRRPLHHRHRTPPREPPDRQPVAGAALGAKAIRALNSSCR